MGTGEGREVFSVAQQKGNNERRQKQVSRLTSPFLQPVDTSGGGGGIGEVEVGRGRAAASGCQKQD